MPVVERSHCYLPHVRRKVMKDPELDLFRNGIALLRDADGHAAGYLATIVNHFWTPFRPLTWQERVWWLVTWNDGRRERIEEDYPPWTLVDEVRHGYAELEVSPGVHQHFGIEWLHGGARTEAWQRHGVLEDVGAYMDVRDADR